MHYLHLQALEVEVIRSSETFVTSHTVLSSENQNLHFDLSLTPSYMAWPLKTSMFCVSSDFISIYVIFQSVILFFSDAGIQKGVLFVNQYTIVSQDTGKHKMTNV
jgi:hypothetical protein